MLSIYKPSEERSYKPSEEHRWISAILSEFLSPEWGRELNDGERAYVKRQLKDHTHFEWENQSYALTQEGCQEAVNNMLGKSNSRHIDTLSVKWFLKERVRVKGQFFETQYRGYEIGSNSRELNFTELFRGVRPCFYCKKERKLFTVKNFAFQTLTVGNAVEYAAGDYIHGVSFTPAHYNRIPLTECQQVFGGEMNSAITLGYYHFTTDYHTSDGDNELMDGIKTKFFIPQGFVEIEECVIEK